MEHVRRKDMGKRSAGYLDDGRICDISYPRKPFGTADTGCDVVGVVFVFHEKYRKAFTVFCLLYEFGVCLHGDMCIQKLLTGKI